ncbi:MAG: hypothetical protein KatS3mg105_2325 [Gemmatales bacterium]|nr:MAG: hypothetical protein KatS3mg105_2325 [Gemmatales bacterium]
MRLMMLMIWMALFWSFLPPVSAAAEQEAKTRLVLFTYAGEINSLPPGKRIRVWLPFPPSNEAQTVKLVRQQLPATPVQHRELTHNNRILYFEAKADRQGKVPFSLTYRVKRKEIRSPVPARESDLERFLRADRLVPVSGKPLELLRGKQLPPDDWGKARFLYDLVEKHMRYSKEGSGWGSRRCRLGVHPWSGQLHRFSQPVYLAGPGAQDTCQVRYRLSPAARTRRRRNPRLPLLGLFPDSRQRLDSGGYFRSRQKPQTARLLLRQHHRESDRFQRRPRPDPRPETIGQAAELFRLSLCGDRRQTVGRRASHLAFFRTRTCRSDCGGLAGNAASFFQLAERTHFCEITLTGLCRSTC